MSRKSTQMAKVEDAAHNAEDAKAGTKAPDAKVATFPHETMINAYGFLQFGKEVMTALGVSKTEKSESGKAVYPITKVSITGYNTETHEITIKVA